jgi:D-2-hydroxyacid dehydrogenase (NADP+)
MPSALYYKPSYERLESLIKKIAPKLEIALLEVDGSLTFDGGIIPAGSIAPDFAWIHAELFKSKQLHDYFNLLKKTPPSWLHTINTGLDMLPYRSLIEQGVLVTNNHSQAPAIAEYVIGQILAALQNHELLKIQQNNAVWKQRSFIELAGMHCVIIGFGHIGQEIALRARSFGVSITAIRRKEEKDGLADHVCTLRDLPNVLPTADIVILACTANKATRGLVDINFLNLLKPSCLLVNVARGDLIEESCIKAVMDSGRPGKLILDVFAQEPLAADSWLWQHPAVIVTPHSSNLGSGMLRRSDELFLKNLERSMLGEELLNIVPLSELD